MRLASRLGERCMEGEGFGDCLKRFMATNPSEHVCTPKCLAGTLLYADAGSVNRWRRGENTPKLDAGVIGKIITHLALTEDQAQELREAQARSLRKGTKPRGTPKFSAHTSIGPLITRGRQPNAQPLGASPRRAPTDDAQSGGILHDMIALLEGLPDATGLKDDEKTITLTWQGRDAFEMSDALQARWRAALQSVLRCGWRINYLCRLDRNIHRTVRLVEMMFDYVGTGNYFPRYFTSYGTLASPYDMLVVPGVAAALLFSGRTAHNVDGGMMIWNAQHVAMLAAHAQQLTTQTTPLVRAYFMTDEDEDDNEDYLAALHEAERYAGGRIAVIDGMTAITQPQEWFDLQSPSRYTAWPEFEDWRARHASRMKSITAFKSHVSSVNRYREIATESGLDELARHGIYYSRRKEMFQQQKPLRLEHLRNIVNLLHYDGYDLALVSDYQRKDSGSNGIHIDATWAVTGNNSVFLETWAPDEAGRPRAVSLHITEPTMAGGFREYFEEMWERIPYDNRDKAKVIARLERYIAELERDLASSPD